MFRETSAIVEVFLVHPGGPLWAKKDEGAWTIPKGEYDDDEQPLAAARREFTEETGFVAMEPFIDLGSIRQKSGKVVVAWAFRGDCDPANLISNTCEIEWPPRSKRKLIIPEIDRGEWFPFDRAQSSIRSEQVPLLNALQAWLSTHSL